MKKIFVLASVAFITACNSSNEPAKVDATTPSGDSTTIVADINSPYQVSYSSKFEIGDPKYAETILTLWKDWDAGTPGAHKDFFADSVEMYFADGSMLKGTRDEATAGAEAHRGSMKSAESRVDAVTSLKSKDMGENWALVWGMEKDVLKSGKVDSFNLQETWRFDKNGKVNLLYQFRSEIAKPKK